ncbi:MAG: selenide, water dikinase SelD, partial [Firmicutes bacterium]|nr:selenide, water dikinase SelD [Bacillota bacterium]
MGPETLAQVLCSLPKMKDENLLSGDNPYADSSIYRIDAHRALVQSVDFFTPVVDDPYLFGQIAAANALSDIYAVGGKPLTALNLVSFPAKEVDLGILKEILKGGADKVLEADAVIAGGHSIEDKEPKYGLAVTGIINLREIVDATRARPGDQLVLTKPIGTGILMTALKGGFLKQEEIQDTLNEVAGLNRRAAEAMKEVGVSACTDITGFGLVGHMLEMAAASKVCLKLNLSQIPLYPRVEEMAAMGLIPGGSIR